MLDEKDLQAIDALIARRLGVVVESEIMPQFNLLAEGQQTLLQSLAPRSRVEQLEEEVGILKTAIRTLSQDVAELKRAQ